MTAPPQTADVVIVGAGPSGLALAIGLAQRGVRFVVLDALPEAENTSRAAVIHAGTLEVLRDLGLTDRLVDAGIAARRFRVRERSRVPMRVDFGVLASPTPFALMIPQDEAEALMTGRQEALGHAVHRPHRGVAVERRADGAVVRSRSPATACARWRGGAFSRRYRPARRVRAPNTG